jgi:hypothetical protein
MRVFLVFFSLFVFSACKKVDTGTPQMSTEPSQEECLNRKRLISEDIKQADFKPGTYWILFDSITSGLDSISVKSNRHFVLEYPKPKGQCQAFADEIILNFDHYSYSFGSSPSVVTPSVYSYMVCSDEMIVINGYPNNYPWGGPKIYYNFDIVPKELIALKTIDSLFVYDTYYKRIINTIGPVRFYNPNSSETNPNYTYHHYFNVAFGFLKIKIFDSQNTMLANKVLIRSKIVR